MYHDEKHNQPGPAASSSSIFNLTIDDLRTSIHQMMNDDDDDTDNTFITRTATNWLLHQRDKPIARQLFGELWFEHELCILFADTNLGKSILAVQIANSIAKGEAISPFNPNIEPQVVLYFDFELSGRQFESRYVDDYKNPFNFSHNLYRAALNPLLDVPEGFNSFEEYVCLAIEREIITTKATVIIIDNITYLRTETERAKDALPLMKQLKALKEKYSLSILALAHTPKRDKTAGITRNDLQGSKMLINFCDSAFSIGESQKDSATRYLKQIKQRNTEELYGEGNVLVYHIAKPTNFLHYVFIGYSREREHLRVQTDEEASQLEENIKNLKNQGFSLRQIGKELGISHTRVERMLTRLAD